MKVKKVLKIIGFIYICVVILASIFIIFSYFKDRNKNSFYEESISVEGNLQSPKDVERRSIDPGLSVFVSGLMLLTCAFLIVKTDIINLFVKNKQLFKFLSYGSGVEDKMERKFQEVGE